MTFSKLDLVEVAWSEVREEIHKLNPKLAAICDKIDPSKNYPLIKIKYPYGAMIVSEGDLCLPTDM